MLATVRGIHALGQEARDTIGCADRVLLHEVMQHVDKPLDWSRCMTFLSLTDSRS